MEATLDSSAPIPFSTHRHHGAKTTRNSSGRKALQELNAFTWASEVFSRLSSTEKLFLKPKLDCTYATICFATELKGKAKTKESLLAYNKTVKKQIQEYKEMPKPTTEFEKAERSLKIQTLQTCHEDIQKALFDEGVPAEIAQSENELSPCEYYVMGAVVIALAAIGIKILLDKSNY